MIPGQVFDKIFMILDMNGNNRVSKEEIMEYFVRLVEGKQAQGEQAVTERNESEIEMEEK